MDAKLNHSDLSALLAKESGISLVKAELLTKTFFDLVIEGLENDGIVKINGLGTFKLTDVASRSSVNVNTGEKFEIKGHKKLVFTPADTLKECVNQPFAMFEPVEVDETYSDDVEEDNSELVAEENNVEEYITADADTSVDEVIADKEEEVLQQASESAPDVEEVQIETSEEVPVESQKRPEPVMVNVPKKEKKPFAVPEQKKKRGCKWLYITLLVLLVLALIFALFLFLYKTPYKSNQVTVNETVKIISPTESVRIVTIDSTTINLISEDIVTVSTIKVDTIKANVLQSDSLESKENNVKPRVDKNIEPEEYKFVITKELALLDLKNITSADTTLYDIVGVWAEHKVSAHETLTRIALKYYGDKKLWPYIVKCNSLISPDKLSKGMKILIPKLKPTN